MSSSTNGMMSSMNLNNLTCFRSCFGIPSAGKLNTNQSKINSTEITRTISKNAILPLGSPSLPSVSALPSEIPLSCLIKIEPAQRSSSLDQDLETLSLSTENSPTSFRSDNSFHEGNVPGFSKPQNDVISSVNCTGDKLHRLETPLSLVELCIRNLCLNRDQWVNPKDRIACLNFSALPPELVQLLFYVACKHRLLTENLIGGAFIRLCCLVSLSLTFV